MSFILALISATSFGTADFFGGIASKRMSWLKVIGLAQAAGVVVALGSLLIVPPETISTADILWGSAAGLCLITGVGLLYRSLAEGQMSVVAPVTALTAIALPVMYGVATGEHLGLIPLGGILLAVVAVILLGRGEDSAPAAAIKPSFPPLLVALIAGGAIGIEYIALDQTAPESGLVPPLAARITCGLLVALYVLTQRGNVSEASASPGGLRFALLAGVFDAIALSLYVVAVRGDSLPLIATIASLYPAATIALACIVLREKPNRSQKFGLSLALVAILALANAPLTGG